MIHHLLPVLFCNQVQLISIWSADHILYNFHWTFTQSKCVHTNASVLASLLTRCFLYIFLRRNSTVL